MCGWAAIKIIEGNRVPVSRWLSLILFVLGGGLLLAFSSPLAVEFLQADKAGDFKTVDAQTVLAAWSGFASFPLWLWGVGAAAFVIAVVTFALRKTGLAIAAGIAASLLIGWHVRTYFLPGQTWIQATETGKLALAEVCGLPTRNPESCTGEAPPSRVLALGYAEPSYVLTVGTQSLHPPETPVKLPRAETAYPVVYLVNLEDKQVADQLARLERQAKKIGLCETRSANRYALNYSNNDPVNFVAIRYDWACAGDPEAAS